MMKQPVISEKVPLEFGHTCHNNFVVLDYRRIESPPTEILIRLAGIFCATPLADNLLVLQDSEIADVHLRILGGDGREANFCGNGTAYVAAKVGKTMKRDRVRIETANGVKTAVKLGREWKVEIGPALLLDEELARVPVSMLRGTSILGLVRAGEPHLVVDTPEIFNGFHVHIKDFEDYCRPLRNITNIAGGINITMVFENKDRKLLIRTFERGARRQTFSCGTGSVSAAAALFGNPPDGRVFDVCSPGGVHKVIYEMDRWYLIAVPQRIGIGHLKNSVIYLPLAELIPYAA